MPGPYFRYLLWLTVGAAGGFLLARALPVTDHELVRFAETPAPMMMIYALRAREARQYAVDDWQMLRSPVEGNDSLVLKYRDKYVASFSASSQHGIDMAVINQPAQDAPLLILEGLDSRTSTGKMTLELLADGGGSRGFLIDENLDGQFDLRFSYDGRLLEIWLNDAWAAVERRPRPDGLPGFLQIVQVDGRPYRVTLTSFPYRLEPLDAAGAPDSP